MTQVRWEKVKTTMMGRPSVYWRGMAGGIELCTVNKWPRKKNDFYLSLHMEILDDVPHTKTPGKLMRLVEARWAEWLNEAGVIIFTEDLAKEVIHRIDQTSFEEDESEEDKKLRAWVEGHFPTIREHREDEEYKDWLWAIRVEADPRVKKARAKTQRNDPSGDPDPRWAAIDEMFAVKGKVLKELIAKDQEPLKAEWKKDKNWRQRVDRVS